MMTGHGEPEKVSDIYDHIMKFFCPVISCGNQFVLEKDCMSNTNNVRVSYDQIMKDLSDARDGKLSAPPQWFGKKIIVTDGPNNNQFNSDAELNKVNENKSKQ